MPIRCDTCLHKNMHVGVHPSVLDALTTPQLLPSAQLQQANYSRQSLLSPHSFLPSSPFVPLPTAAHTAQSQISYSLAQRAAYERESEKKRGDSRAVDGLTARFDGDCLFPIWTADDILLILMKLM